MNIEIDIEYEIGTGFHAFISQGKTAICSIFFDAWDDVDDESVELIDSRIEGEKGIVAVVNGVEPDQFRIKLLKAKRSAYLIKSEHISELLRGLQ